MRPHAPNFNITTGTSGVALHPLPTITYFTARGIQVETSAGRRWATELTIHGTNFLIRAVEPVVLVNGEPLVSFRIDDDFDKITGYFFGVVTNPVQIIVDYGLGVRGEWTGYGNISGLRRSKLLGWLLVVLLVLLLLAAVVLALAATAVLWLYWVFLLGAIVLNVIAILISWKHWTMGAPTAISSISTSTSTSP